MLIKKTRIPVLHILFIGMLPSFLKKIVYRALGYSIGKKVSLSPGSVILGRKVSIHDHVKIGFFTILRGREISIGRYVKIGSMSVLDTERIFVGEDSRINEQVYIGGMRSPGSSFHLGKRCIIMQLSYINPTLPVFIDDDSGIGGHCLIFTHGSWNSQLEGFPVKFAPVHIGKKVWLPWRVFVMPGVTIGDNVVIGANSLVGNDLPANCFAAGSPASVIRQHVPVAPDDEQRKNMLDSIFNEFFDYLKYHEFNCKINETEHGFVAAVNGMTNGTVHYVKGPQIPDSGKTDQVLVLYEAGQEMLTEAMRKGFGMAVSISALKRSGSNPAGEELLAFFSRYGIRCERMD